MYLLDRLCPIKVVTLGYLSHRVNGVSVLNWLILRVSFSVSVEPIGSESLVAKGPDSDSGPVKSFTALPQ
jgi:hypothetical protein